VTDTTTATKTETELLDRLDELGYRSINLFRNEAGTSHDISCNRVYDGPDLTDVDTETGGYAKVCTHGGIRRTHLNEYGPTRHDALTALVALAEQQADR
jgi:hypothetical protein